MMPDEVRRKLVAAVVVLGVTAALANIGHVYDLARHGKQPEALAVFIALTPDILLPLALVKLKYDRRSFWAWVGLLSSITFVVLAGILTADPRFMAADAPAELRQLVAVWPVWVAVVAAGLLEAGRRTETPAAVQAERKDPPVAPRPPRAPAPAVVVAKPATKAATATAVKTPSRPREHATTRPELTATAPVRGESQADKRRRLETARADCVLEVASKRQTDVRVSIGDIKAAYGAGDTWAKAVSAEAKDLAGAGSERERSGGPS
jgi:type IV secretory pathway VirB10-like protein